MAQRFEYDVLVLEHKPGAAERTYRWRCCKHGSCHEPNELEPFLNQMGAEGWHVAAHTADGRFGTTVILQRQLDEGGSQPHIMPVGAPQVYPAPTLSLGREEGVMLLAEIKALRQAAEAAPSTSPPVTAEAIAEALAPIADELRTAAQAIASVPPPAAPIATLDETTLARLEAAVSRPMAPAVAQAVLDPAAFAGLEETLRQVMSQASMAPATATLDPEAIQWLEGVLSQSRERDQDDEPPTGPPVAVLDEAAAVRIGQVLDEATQRWASSLPVPQLHVRAALDAESLTPLRATLDPALFARLEETLRVLAARPLQPATATLDEAARAQLTSAFREALACLPIPLVTTALDENAVESLRSSLMQAVACLPHPTIAPFEVSTTLAPEAVEKLTEALRAVAQRIVVPTPTIVQATLDPESVTRLEQAVCRAVASAFAAPESEEVHSSVEVAPLASWWSWPRVSQRLWLAFGR